MREQTLDLSNSYLTKPQSFNNSTIGFYEERHTGNFAVKAPWYLKPRLEATANGQKCLPFSFLGIAAKGAYAALASIDPFAEVSHHPRSFSCN